MSNYIRLFYMAVITYLCPNIDASSLTFVSKKRLLAITDKYVMQWKKIKVPQQHIQKDPVHWYCIDSSSVRSSTIHQKTIVLEMLNLAHKSNHYNAIENYKFNIKITFPKEWITRQIWGIW